MAEREKRKAETPAEVTDTAADKKVKSESTTAKTEVSEEGKSSVLSFENIEEDDEFQEFEVYDWDTADTPQPDSLNFQDNWDEDANDKDFVAQLRKELGK